MNSQPGCASTDTHHKLINPLFSKAAILAQSFSLYGGGRHYWHLQGGLRSSSSTPTTSSSIIINNNLNFGVIVLITAQSSTHLDSHMIEIKFHESLQPQACRGYYSYGSPSIGSITPDMAGSISGWPSLRVAIGLYIAPASDHHWPRAQRAMSIIT